MIKKLFYILFISLISFLLMACDGGSKTSDMSLKSHIDGSMTTISLSDKVSGFYQGDVLSPSYGRTTFTTKGNRSLEDLFKEIKINSPHFQLDIINNNNYIMILDNAGAGKKRSFFIRFLESDGKVNKFLTGETKVNIIDENNPSEEKLLLFPFQYTSDDLLNDYIQSNHIKFNQAYALSVSSNIEDFLNYYQNIGWVNLEKTEDSLIIDGLNFSQDDFSNYSFLESFILDFSEEGFVSIHQSID